MAEIKSSQRTLALFEYFAQEQRPLTIKELSDGIGIPQSSTSVLVQSLTDSGYLEKNKSARAYYPTLRISLLGLWLQQQHRRAGQLPNLLAAVTKKTGESTILAMKNGIYAQYLIAQMGRGPNRIRVESGMLFPLACCATGWCLLTLESQANVKGIVRRTCAEVTEEHWRITAKAAPDKVAFAQKNGYAISNGETTEGLGAVAVLLPSLPGAYAMSVGVGGRCKRIEAKKDLILEALEDLRVAIRQMARQGQSTSPDSGPDQSVRGETF